MEALGFKYHPRRKTYYVDGHENSENVAYRKKYISSYLELETRCFRWIILSEEEVIALENEDKDQDFSRNFGYKFNVNELTFYEFHVDDHESFQHRCRYLPFGGHLSIRGGKKTRQS